MIQFIATFYSQYGAVQFYKQAKKHHIDCKLAPVPRMLSSSCGTCALYTSEIWDTGFAIIDLEAIYTPHEEGYTVVLTNE